MPVRAFAGTKGRKIFFSSLPKRDYYEHDHGLRDRLDKYDNELRDRLEQNLSVWLRYGLMTVWHDGKLTGGRSQSQEITAHLEAAEIILVLLSSEFLSSDFCYAQMQDAMKRYEEGEALVVPVLLRPTPGWEDLPIGQLKPLPAGKLFYPLTLDTEAEWCYKVAQGLRSLVPDPALSPDDARSIHPRAYQRMPITPPPALLSTSMVQRTGRVEAIYRRLTQDTPVALIMTGPGGSGKSALVAQVFSSFESGARTGLGAFTDGPLWLHIDETITLADVVGTLCHTLGRPSPPFLELAARNLSAQGLARELFHIVQSTPRLFIFDQFETWLDPQTGRARPQHRGVDEWLALLNASPQACAGRVLLTTRFYPHAMLRDCQHIEEYPVAGLEIAESIQLLRTGNIAALEQATDAALATLAQRCQGHAQALVWQRELFKGNASLTLSDLLHQPYYQNQWSGNETFERLNEIYTRYLNHEQRELLLAFAVYRRAVPFEAALTVMQSVPRAPAGTQLLLLNLGLLQAAGNDLYRIHPVAADFVRAYFEQHDHQRLEEAHLRAARYYQEQYQGSISPDEFDQWLDVVEAAWHLCRAVQRDEAYRLIQETKLFATLYRQGNNTLLLDLYLQLLARKDWPGEREAQLQHEMGEIRNALGQPVEALQAYWRALHLFRQTNQLDRVVEALNNMGAMYRWLKRYEKAQARYQEALRICAETPDDILIIYKGATFNNLGRLVFERGKQTRVRDERARYYREALDYYEQALLWYQESGFREEEGITFNNLGEVYQALGEREQARKYYWQALQQFQREGNRRWEGTTLSNLGLLYHELAGRENQENAQEAYTCCKQALRIFREIGDRRQETIVLRNLGRLRLTDRELEVLKRDRQSLACFLVARKTAVFGQESQLPIWVENTIRRDLAHLDAPSYEEFVREVEAQAEQIVEEMLR